MKLLITRPHNQAKTFAAALESRGVVPEIIPDEYVPEAILEAGDVSHEIAVYQTVQAKSDVDGLAALKSGGDVVTFNSPSAVTNFVEIVSAKGLNPLSLPGNPKIAWIGTITQKTAEEVDFVGVVVVEEYTVEGLLKPL